MACGEGSRYHDTDCLALEDYFRRLALGHNVSTRVMAKALWSLTTPSAAHKPAGPGYSPTPSSAELYMPIGTTLVVWNSLGWSRDAVVQAQLPRSLRVPHGAAGPLPTVRDAAGKPVVAQMAVDGNSVYFKAMLPAAAAATFSLVHGATGALATGGRATTFWPNVTDGAPKSVENSAIRLTFAADGKLASISSIADAVTVNASQVRHAAAVAGCMIAARH